jgi:hypothetical protein
MNILTVNLLFSTLVFSIAARLYLVPRLHELSARSVLLPILLLHAPRHLGLMFLAPGATDAGLPPPRYGSCARSSQKPPRCTALSCSAMLILSKPLAAANSKLPDRLGRSSAYVCRILRSESLYSL